MLKQCCECGAEPEDSLIIDVDIYGNPAFVCGPCFRGEKKDEE